MKRFVKLYLACLCTLATGSCIRESLPDCPPFRIVLSVKDKNYFNIDDAVKLGLLERKADSLPFRDYIHSLYYIVHDADGNVVAEQNSSRIDNDDQTQVITLPTSLPYGTYTLTVWGNMDGESSLGTNSTEAEMETFGTATYDIYLASGTFEYDYGNETYALGMERTKGNLLIKAEEIPDNIDFSTKNIQGVFGTVDNNFSYTDLTDVKTELDWTVQNEIQTQTLMCPSASFESSTLSMVFFDKSQMTATSRSTLYPSLTPQDINITIGRNQITILKYVYQEGINGPDFDIYLGVNDNWELLHQMEIE